MRPYLLARFFHEIALKGKNQAFFLETAKRNLERAIVGTGVVKVRRGPMMAILELPEGVDLAFLKERLSTLLGVEKLSLAYQAPSDVEGMKPVIEELLAGRVFRSFRITARRADKTFPLTSQQLNEELGAYVQGLTGVPVNLKQPELNIFVQVLHRESFVYLDESKGAGGLPVGVGGRVASLSSGGIDSPVAAWRMMKRGCHVLFVHFHSFPLVEGTSREKVVDLVRLLTTYQFHSLLYLVPFAEIQKRILVSTPPRYRVILYRRFMFRIAEALAKRHNAQALVTGESLGQVSSQTLENMVSIGEVASLPVLRPLVVMDKEEIVQQARGLGTYPISIIPDQDCCSLFVPKHPATRSNVEEVRHLEELLDVPGMVQEAVSQAEAREFVWPG